MLDKIKVDIVSDVSCPWCIIGYKAFEKALLASGLQDSVDVHWKAFELNPNMPPEGQDKREHLEEKYGASREQIMQNRQHIVQRGADLDFIFNYKEDSRVYNTFDAHRLIHWAAEHDLQTPLKLALFDLYFTQNSNPSNRDELLRVVEEVGLDKDQAQEILASEQYAQEVRTQQAMYSKAGVRSVPAFIFNDKHLISGGQPPEVFKDFLQNLLAGNIK